MARTWAPTTVTDAGTQLRHDRWRWRQLVMAISGLGLVIGVIAYGTAPRGLSVALLGLVLACVAAFIRPAIGLHLIVFLSLIGDDATTPWWPFTKNLSSRESMFFVADGVSLTPLEIMLAVIVFSFVLRAISQRNFSFRRGRMFAPLMIFGVFIVFGLAKGVVTGGNRTVALFEFRPLLYLVVLYLLMTNLFVSRRQYRIAFVLALVAVGIQSLFALSYWRSLTAAQREVLASLSEHTASVTMNVLFVVTLGLIVFRGTRWKRWAMLPLLVPVVYAYLLSQRRAGMVALFAGFVVFLAVLFARDRRRFWRITPPILVLGTLLIIATWNVSGAIGLPSAALKSVLFPGALDVADQRSDFYRELEAYNLWFTIRQSPLTGFGFGQPFAVIRRMPNIDFFEYWQYLPHNSVLWIWIKTGFFGFVAMLYMFARVIQRGARAARLAPSADDAAMIVAALSYVVMFVVFAYVDIAWSIRPAVVLALCLALCADTEDLADDDTPEWTSYQWLQRERELQPLASTSERR